jgi:hypothetical protein
MSDDDFDIEIIDDAALGEIDAIESAYATGSALPPRSLVNKPGLVQRDLFGGVVAPPAQKPPPKVGPSRTGTSGSAGGSVGETRAKVRLSKTWDPASFAKHGWSKKNAAVAKARAKGKSGKGKQRAYASDEDPWDEEDVLDDEDEDSDGEEFFVDTTYDPNAPILPIKWPPDEQAAKTFVYPVQPDKPLRVYQYNIVQRCLYENTLVSLPTGLGKTFIAAVVMCVPLAASLALQLTSRLAGSTSTAGTLAAKCSSSRRLARSSRSRSRRATTSPGSPSPTASSSRAGRCRSCEPSDGRPSGSSIRRLKPSSATWRKEGSTRAT